MKGKNNDQTIRYYCCSYYLLVVITNTLKVYHEPGIELSILDIVTYAVKYAFINKLCLYLLVCLSVLPQRENLERKGENGVVGGPR